ncbi:MAG: PH domain-containing protein [Planctomycetaceae bacterium]
MKEFDLGVKSKLVGDRVPVVFFVAAAQYWRYQGPASTQECTDMPNDPQDVAGRGTEPSGGAGVPAAAPTSRPAPRPAVADESAVGPEKDLWIGRTSWKHYIGRFGLLVLIVLAGGAAIIYATPNPSGINWSRVGMSVVALALVAGAIIAGPVLWAILSHRYRLTTQRLIIERGIFSQTIDQTELVRVDDVRIHKSLTDRILGLGSVEVISTDATDREIVIPGVTTLDQLADSIRARMKAARQRAVYVEHV